MTASKHFWDNVKNYVNKGDIVAELYNGNRPDILIGLSELVSDLGIVYGVDLENPFEEFQYMRDLSALKNIKLVNASIPPLPDEAQNLNAIIVREFMYTWRKDSQSKERMPRYISNPECLSAINHALKNESHLIIHLNETEQETERLVGLYQGDIAKFLTNFKNVYNHFDLLVYKKI